MSATAHIMIEPLIRRHIFRNEDDAVKTLLRTYIVNQLGELQQRNDAFKRKYRMEFESFGDYLHERSELLRRDALSPEERQAIGRAIMQEEDDWFDWKVALEMLDAWIGIRQEVKA